MIKRVLSLLTFFSVISSLNASAQYECVSLDSCRQMAIRNNKEISITQEKIRQAGYQRAQAKAAYLPSIDMKAAYFYNSKKLTLIDEDGESAIDAIGTLFPNLADKITNYLTFNIHNVFAGAVTITQPVYMGGKIKAMNDITKYAEQLAHLQNDRKVEDVVYQVDQAYWQVVSLEAKHKLAKSYVCLLDTLNSNVEALFKQGFATQADVLSVSVKLNEANIDLTKVENGVELSRMLLAQVCGLPVETKMTLADEGKDAITVKSDVQTEYNIDDVLARRKEVNAMELGVKIYEKKAKVALSEMLPKVAVMGMYSLTTPSSFRGFKNKFGGMFSVGAMVSIPIWHWKGDYNKYRAAKSDAIIQRYELEDVCEKIQLQVAQAKFKLQEAMKKYDSTHANLDKANENLRVANIGFKEGVIPASNMMAAQTAWLKANSEAIDAQIDVQLCDVYLSKVLGAMKY